MHTRIWSVLVLFSGLLVFAPTAFSIGSNDGGYAGGGDPYGKIKVAGIRAVSRERLGNGYVDITYRLKIKNRGPALTNVVVTVFSKKHGVEILDDTVTLAEVGTGVVMSSDTFKLRKKKKTRVRSRDLKFKFSSDDPDANEAPVADAGMDQTVDTGVTVSLDGSASSDADGDPLTYSWSLQLPPNSNASLSDPTSSNPTFSADVAGSYTAMLIVNDGTVDSAPDSVTVTATDIFVNTPPVADAGPDQAVDTGTVVVLDGSASSDADQDPLTYAWALQTPANSNAALSDPTSVNPVFTADIEGVYSATLVVNDGTEDSSVDGVSITATDVVNTPPVAIVGADQEVTVGTQVALDGSASNDVDQDPLTFLWTLDAPSDSSAALSDPASVTPTFVADVAGSYFATLVVNDGNADSAPASTMVEAIFTGTSAPVISSTPVTTGSVNTAYTYSVEASDADQGDTLTYSLMLSPADMTIDALTGVINWLPDASGAVDVDVVVTDSTGLTDRQIYLLTVDNGSDDQPPTLAPIADQSSVVNQTILVMAVGTDPEGEPVRYGLSAAPPGMVINTTNGELLWTPGLSQVGSFVATVTATDPGGQSDSASFNIDVAAEAANNPPVIQDIADQVLNPLQTLNLTLAASDADTGDVLTFALSGAPAGMQFDARTGTINWVADTSNAGPVNLTASVTDSAGASASTTFSITVLEAPRPPVAVDDAYTIDRNLQLQVVADGVLQNDTDPNGDVLTAANTTEPVLGTLNSFPGDGGFDYTPPANPNITVGLREQCRSPTPTIARYEAPLVGDIDADGQTEIIGVSPLVGDAFNYRLWVIEGATCTFESDVTVNYQDVGVPNTTTMPALVNLDADPELELVLVRNGPPELGVDPAGLVALNQDGTLVWDVTPDGSSESVSFPLSASFNYYDGQTPTVTDLDGDGSPEILMTLHYGTAGASQFFSAIVAYNADGSIRWEYQGVPQGGDADGKGVYIADLDLDGTVEILHHTNVLDHNGQLEFLLPAELDIFGVASSQLTLAIANFDNDPFPEILARDIGNHYVFEHDGALKWSSPVPNSARAEITVAELDGDPQPEFVYHTGQGTGNNASWLSAYDTDGTQLWTHEGTVYDGPATALDSYHGATAFDYDQDGIDEITIALPANNGRYLYVFRGDDGSLVDSFTDGEGGTDGHVFVTIADVDNDGAAEVIYSDSIGFGQDPYVVLEGLAGNPLPPARPVRHQYLYQPTHVNTDGSLPPYPQPHWLIPGLNKFHAAPVIPFEDPGTTDSFNYTASDGIATSNEASVTIAITNVNAPTIISRPELGASPGFDYQYGLLATDGDFGDVFTWTLVDAPAGMTVSTFGIIDWTPATGDLGPNRVHVVVTDAQGNSDEQAYVINVEPPVTVPDIIGSDESSATAAIEGAGLAVGSVTQGFSLTVPAGGVISQSVSGGGTSAAGAFIDFVISLGPQPIFVPSLIGINTSVADATLTSLSLNLGNVTFVNDATVPRGVIIDQAVAANSEVAVNTSIDVTVSGGPAFAISLARNFMGPDESVDFSLASFDNAGNPVAAPGDLSLSVESDADASGSLPVINGSTLQTATDSRGAFSLRVQSSSLGIDLSQEILVSTTLAADGVQAPYAELSGQINRLIDIFDALALAIADNDLPAIQVLGSNLASERAAIDLEALRTTPPTAPETGFLPLTPPGAPSSSDEVFPQVLAGLVSQLNETGAFLQTLNPGIARDDDLRNRFLSNALADRAQLFNPELLTQLGSVAFAPGLHQLLSVATPELVIAEADAVLTALDDAGLLANHTTSAEFYQQLARFDGRQDVVHPTFFTLGGLMSGTSVRMNIIKNYYFPIVKKVVFHMQNLVLEGLIRQLIAVQDIPGIVTGASLSFHSFKLGNSIIESNSAAEFPDGNIVILIGPTLLADVQAALSGLGVSFGNLREVREAYENVRDTAQAARDALSQNYTQLIPDQSVNGCVFSGVIGCRQLGFSDGIPSVYGTGQFPAPVLMLVYNAVTGEISLGNYLFFSRPHEDN